MSASRSNNKQYILFDLDGTLTDPVVGITNSVAYALASFGIQGDQSSQAKVLFDSLRRCDELGAKTVYVRAPQKDGIGLAVYNRLLRAAGFTVVNKDGNPV